MIYPVLLQASGLSLREAAAFHDVRLSSVENWSSGRRPAPAGAVADLHGLVQKQMRAAREALPIIREHSGAAEIEIGAPVDDHEAQTLGWPCKSAWGSMCGMLLAILTADELARVVIVPRGSTSATAAASDAH